MFMNKRGDLRTYSVVGGIAATYLFVVFLGCYLWPLDFIDCAYSFQPFHFVLFAPAGLSFTAVSLVLFYETRESRKTAITYTGIVSTVTVLVSFTMSQIVSVTHNTAIFCLILVVVWISLSLTKSLRMALLSWVIVAGFLVYVMIEYPDNRVLVSLLYALFSGGVALHATGANKLSEYAGIVVVVTIPALVCVMAYAAVVEWGMSPLNYERLVFNTLSRTYAYVGGIMIVASGFFGLIPFVYLFTKNK